MGGKGGRKRTPDHLKVVRGTYRADRANPDAPPPSQAKPVAPNDFDDPHAAAFAEIVGRLEELGIASASHTRVIALAAQRQVEIAECNEILRADGMTYDTTNQQGERMIKANPAVRIRSEAMRHLHSLMSELGLTPASASKVSAGKKPGGTGNGFLDLESG